MKPKLDLSRLIAALPLVIPRAKVADLIGPIYSPNYLAKLDSEGKGPVGAFKLGNKVMYWRERFVEWLARRAKSLPSQIPTAQVLKAQRPQFLTLDEDDDSSTLAPAEWIGIKAAND